jgi:hypothetical protein
MSDIVVLPIGPRGWTGVICGQRKIGDSLLLHRCGGAIIKAPDEAIACEKCGHVPEWA